MGANIRYLRRKQAAAYLLENYGFGSAKTLAKLATLGGGPEIFYAGRLPLYVQEKLDDWALAKISPPVRSTSEKKIGGGMTGTPAARAAGSAA